MSANLTIAFKWTVSRSSVLLVIAAALLACGLGNAGDCDGNNGGTQPPCAGILDALRIDLDTGECAEIGEQEYGAGSVDGTYRVVLNARSLPTEINADAAQITLAWSADASNIQATIQDDQGSETFTFPVDLSDTALLAMLDILEGRTGDDLSTLRDFIYANPGLVLAIAQGDNPDARVLAPDSGSDASAKLRLDIAQNAPAFRDLNEYIEYLARESLMLEGWADALESDIRQAGRSPTRLEQLMIDIGRSLGRFLGRVMDDQVQACFPCTAACALGCMGACTEQSGGLTTCAQMRSTECPPSGHFREGAGCLSGDVGACCISRDGQPLGCRDDFSRRACDDVGGFFNPGMTCNDPNTDCTPSGACCLEDFACAEAEDRLACEQLARQGGYRYFNFSPASNCAAERAEGLCNAGVCCFGDGSYNCDITDEEGCLRAGQDSGRSAHWTSGRCEAATCN